MVIWYLRMNVSMRPNFWAQNVFRCISGCFWVRISKNVGGFLALFMILLRSIELDWHMIAQNKGLDEANILSTKKCFWRIFGCTWVRILKIFWDVLDFFGEPTELVWVKWACDTSKWMSRWGRNSDPKKCFGRIFGCSWVSILKKFRDFIPIFVEPTELVRDRWSYDT